MKKLLRKCNNHLQDRSAVSSIIGTMLLLIIAVSLFSTVYYFVLTMDVTQSTPAVNIVGVISEDNNLILTHFGGKSIQPEDTILINIEGTQKVISIPDYLDDSNNNNLWDLGETISYSPPSITNNSQVEITIINNDTNSISLISTLQRGNLLSKPFVFTKSATEISPTSATMNLEYNFRDEEGTIHFEYKKSGDSEWITTGKIDRSTFGSYSFTLSGLTPNTEYVYFANLSYDTSKIIQGEIVSFQTDALTLETEIDGILLSPTSLHSIRLFANSTGEPNPDNLTLYYRWSNNNWIVDQAFNRSNVTKRTTSGTAYSNAEDFCTSGSPNGEEKDKAFDDNTHTKWLDFCGSDGTSWIQYDYGYGNSYKIAKYSISSANDQPNRDPKDWFLEGSNDNITWTKIDQRSGIMFSSRYQALEFDISDENVSEYQWYRLNITDIRDASYANSVQLSEIELYECEEITTSFTSEWAKYSSPSNPDTIPPWNWEFYLIHGYGYYQFYSIGQNSSLEIENPPPVADAAIFVSFDDFPNNQPGNFTGIQDSGALAFGLDYHETPDSWSLGLRNNTGAYWKLTESMPIQTNEYSEIILVYNWSTIGFNSGYYYSFEYYNDSASDWDILSTYVEGVDFDNNGIHGDEGRTIEWINSSDGFDFSDNFNVRFVCHANPIDLKKFNYQVSIDNIFIIAVRK